jgi:hypothetical protein
MTTRNEAAKKTKIQIGTVLRIEKKNLERIWKELFFLKKSNQSDTFGCYTDP